MIGYEDSLQIVRLVVESILAPSWEMRHKHHLTSVLNRLLFKIQQLDQSPQQTDSFAMLTEFIGKTNQALAQADQKETVMGAINLAETAFTISSGTPDKF